MESSITTDYPVLPAADAPSVRRRSARWFSWVLFFGELVMTSVIIGVLSVVLVVQLTLTSGAVFGEFDDILTWVVGRGADAAIEVAAAIFVFTVTGLVVGLLGLPIRLIRPVRRFWLGNGEVTIAGVVLGALLLVEAYLLGTWGNLHQGNRTFAVFNPSPLPLLVGWFVLAYSLSLLVWPARWLPRRARSWWTETQLTR